MRQFTLAEATEALTEVRPLAEKMVALRTRLRELDGKLRGWRDAMASNGGSRDTMAQRLEEERQAARAELREAVNAIEAMGVLVKGVDQGLVDFPSVNPISGEEVLLCWHVGEAEIGYWHAPEAGFAGRRALPFS